MHGAALRLRTLALLTGISGMLLGMDSTANKPCMRCKAEHRLRKKDENCAKAQRKKLIFAGDFHELFPLSQGSGLVNSCLGVTDHSFRAGIHVPAHRTGMSIRSQAHRNCASPLRHSIGQRRYLVANIANATSFTRNSLLAFLLCTPKGHLPCGYGLIGCASEDHQGDYGCEDSKTKAHINPIRARCLFEYFLLPFRQPSNCIPPSLPLTFIKRITEGSLREAAVIPGKHTYS